MPRLLTPSNLPTGLSDPVKDNFGNDSQRRAEQQTPHPSATSREPSPTGSNRISRDDCEQTLSSPQKYYFLCALAHGASLTAVV